MKETKRFCRCCLKEDVDLRYDFKYGWLCPRCFILLNTKTTHEGRGLYLHLRAKEERK